MNPKRLLATALLALAPLLAHADPVLDAARFTSLSGQTMRMASLQGKVTVVNFWATWCGPCRQEMPQLNEMRAKLAPKGVEVVGIALDNKVEVNNFARELKIAYPLWLGDTETLNLMRQLGNKTGGLPYTLILDKKGNIVARLSGLLDVKGLEDSVKRYL